MDSDLWSDEQALAYIASHADLIDAFGEDPSAGRLHYREHGAAEGRKITFDPFAYADRVDIVSRSRAELAARHYIKKRVENLRDFPLTYLPPGEAGTSYRQRVLSGFLGRYCRGDVVLDVGYSGYDNPEQLTAVPGAIGIDLDYPGYDGVTLPFSDASVDTIFSSHCLEHIERDHDVIQDWHRVLKVGGCAICIVPSQALYEKKLSTPSRWNEDHKRMYTPATLLSSFEDALEVNSYRLRHLRENEGNYNYETPPDVHANSPYEIELVIEKIRKPGWDIS